MGQLEVVRNGNWVTGYGTKDGVTTVIGVDFGHKDDYAVRTVLKKQPDGTVEVVSSERIGRAIDFSNPARQQEVIDEIRNFKL